MIYPIVPYGDPVLRKVAKPIKLGSIDLIKLSEDMFETMYAASGVGLAAPQIGMDIRLFVVEGRLLANKSPVDEILGNNIPIGRHRLYFSHKVFFIVEVTD